MPDPELKAILESHGGDVLSACLALTAENAHLMAVAEGRVLSAEEARQWAAYASLGPPDEIEATVADLARLRRLGTIREAAEAHGLKPMPLVRLIPADAKVVTRETVGDDGEPARLATIDVGDGPVRLADYLAGEFPEFTAALVIPPPPPPRPPCKGTPVPRNRNGSDGPRPLPGQDVWGERLAAEAEASLMTNPQYRAFFP